MSIVYSIYKRLRRLWSREGEKGEYSSGYLPSKIRDEFIEIAKKKNGRLLEIGCREGIFLAGLWQKARHLKIFGVDIEKEEGLLKAKQRLNALDTDEIFLIAANGRKLCFKDSVFDCVVCPNTLFNVSFEHAKEIIKEALRVVKKDQEVIVDIRNKKDYFTSIIFSLAKYYDSQIAVPLRQDSLEDIVKIFKENNALVTEIIPIRAYFNISKPTLIIKAKKL